MSRPSPDPLAERSRFAEMTAVAAASLAGGALAFILAVTVIRAEPLSDDVTRLIWYAIRVAGIGAYLLLWLTTVAGLCISLGIGGKLLSPILYPLHQLGDLALSLAVLHAALLLGDRYAGFTPQMLVIPFTATYLPFWSGLGILALYLSAVVFWSVEVRPRIGYPSWRRIHYASFVAYVFALAHGIVTGTDSTSAIMRVLYLVTGQTVIVLVAWRIRRAVYARRAPKPEAHERPVAARAVAAKTPTVTPAPAIASAAQPASAPSSAGPAK